MDVRVVVAELLGEIVVKRKRNIFFEILFVKTLFFRGSFSGLNSE